MTTETFDSSPSDDRLEHALAAYLRAVEQGQPPSREEWLSRYPDLHQELAAFLDNRNQFEKLLRPTGGPVVPCRFGEYELIQELGRGGMGIVFKARHTKIGRTVALKMVLAGRLASPHDIMRFRMEAEASAQLSHPNIVPLFEVGEVNGQLYFTMKLIEGGSLDKGLERFLTDPMAAVVLMEKVAEAVHAAHRHGIIHRDLKPANILLDVDGQPHITDFGLAKRLGENQQLTESGAIVGTASYMAPEQAAGRQRDLTTAVDVHALGVILYELLTGAPPFEGETTLETLRLVQEREPTSILSTNPKVDKDLEAICLKCLEKAPVRRYASARDLADDLRRWQRREPTHARPVRSTGRLWRWCRRHPERAAAMAVALVLFLATLAAAIGVARTRAARLEEETLTANVYAAQGAASRILWELDRFSLPVLTIAADQDLAALLARCVRAPNDTPEKEQVLKDLQHFIRSIDPKQGDPFQSWHFLDAKGVLVADSVENPKVVGKDFSERDYFQGALAHADGKERAAVHVSRIYQSRNDNLHKFALAVAVRNRADPANPVVGVVAATLTTRATLGTLRLNDQRRKAVLIGRQDQSLPDAVAQTPEDNYLVLVHPAYAPGVRAYILPAEQFRMLQRPHRGDEFALPEPGADYDLALARNANYQDPVGRDDVHYSGPWLAGFAPVGNTEFVVIVQQRYDETIGPEWKQTLVMTFSAGAALVITVLLIAAGLRWRMQRHRPR